jgi:hypothetical protein
VLLQEMQAAYRVLPAAAQCALLARLANELTVSIRGICSAQPQRVSSEAGSAIGAINEMLHQITNQLMALLVGEQLRAPDDTLIAALAFWADQGGTARDLEWCFVQALDWAKRRVP